MSLFETHYSKAQEFYDEGNYEAARVALQHALESNPPAKDCRAQALLGHTYRRLEYDDDARQMFEYCVSHNTTADVYAELSLILAEQGKDSDRAIELASRAIEDDPDIGSAYLALFLIYSKRNEYIQSLRCLKSGLRRGAEYSEQRVFELVRGWCQIYCDEQYYEEAFQVVNEVADYFNSFDFYVLKARLAELSSHPRVSVEYYKRALSFVRSGPMLTDILEAIARLAI